jgi:hypothetical protein
MAEQAAISCDPWNEDGALSVDRIGKCCAASAGTCLIASFSGCPGSRNHFCAAQTGLGHHLDDHRLASRS